MECFPSTSMLESLSVVRTPVLRYSLKSPLHPSVKIGPFRRFNAVAVCAKKDRRSGDGFSWKKKRPSQKYSPSRDNSGDISVLYSPIAVVETTDQLLKNCTRHISDYVEEHNLSEAEKVFELMIKKRVKPNAYTYTALMKGYSGVKNTEKALELFKEMEEKGVEPTAVTFNTAIRSYGSNGDLKEAQSLFKKMKDDYGLDPDVYTYSSMLSVCVTARDLRTARSLFEEMKTSNVEQTVVTVATMIDVYAECCNDDNGTQYLEECRELMEDTEDKGIQANEQTYSTLLKLCARGSLTEDAVKILNEMRSSGMRPNVVSYSTVLDGISKDQSLSLTEVLTLSSKIVREMKRDRVRSNATSFTSLIGVALRLGDLYRADQLFSEMKILKVKPTVVTYGTMIKCYEKLGDPKDGDDYLKPCLDMWHECEQAGMNLSVEGYTSLLSACSKAANLDQASKIWNKMKSNKTKPDASAYAAMINVCICVGGLNKAVSLYNEMKGIGVEPTGVTYATMIKCYEKLGNPENREAYLKPCLNLLKECDKTGLKMDLEGYTSLLSACAKATNLDQALRIWKRMMDNKIKPDVSLYTAMITACLSKDKEDMAFDFLNQMKNSGIKPNVITWGKFMSYFVKKKDKSGAEKICDQMKILGVEPNKSILRMMKGLVIE